MFEMRSAVVTPLSGKVWSEQLAALTPAGVIEAVEYSVICVSIVPDAPSCKPLELKLKV